MVLAVYAVITLSLLYVLYLHISTFFNRRRYSHIPFVPVPLTWKWYIGHIPVLQKRGKEMGLEGVSFSFVQVVDQIRKDLETDSCVIFFPNAGVIFTVSIPIISRVFSDHKTFMKTSTKNSRMTYVNGVRVFGHNGLLTEPGTEVWYHKRKMMDPAFQKKFLKSLMADMTHSANQLCRYLETKKNDKTLDIYNVMNRVALEVVCTCGFSLKEDFISLETSALNQAAETILNVMSMTFSSRNRFSFMLPWKFRKEKSSLKESSDLLRGTMRKLLAERIEKNAKFPDDISNDILDHIIRGNKFSDKIQVEDIIDDFFVFLVAGMETTAITMSIMIWLLLKNPEMAKKVVDEVNEVYEDKEELEYEDLNKLVYLEQCIKECLRLHPPAQLSSRVSPDYDLALEGLQIPKKTGILLPTDIIQKLETHWPDPYSFDPDRFAPGKKIEPFTYFPFTAGPRQCIGKNFAIMEAKVVLAKLYRTFTLYDPYPEETKLEKKNTLTAKPKNGILIGIEH